MSNLYISPTSSENGTPVTPSSPILPKPTINLGKIRNGNWNPPLSVPQGTFTNDPSRLTLESKHYGDPPFFTNAKKASMLERGWVRANMIYPGQTGLYTMDDGPEAEVIVQGSDDPRLYKFIADDGTVIRPVKQQRYGTWDFYSKTTPVPFVPRKGGKKRTQRKRKTLKKRRSQK